MLFEPTAAVAPFPVRLETDYPERLSRLSTFFRIILAIPLLVFVGLIVGGSFVGGRFDNGFVERGAQVTVGALGSLVLAHWIAVLLRGRPVRWLFEVIVAIQRFTLRALSYVFLLTDRYPPFEGEWQVRYDVDYPERLSRWKLVIWKTVTVIPHVIVLALVAIAVIVVVVIAWFTVLFTGRYPEGLHGFVSGWLRWSARAWAYWVSLTDEFPSFSFSADVGPGSSTTYVISAVFGWVIALAWAGGISAFLVWPGGTKEVAVSYEQLLQGEPSAAVEVFDVEVTLLAAGELHHDETAVFQPEEGNRLVQFALRLSNGGDSSARVEEGDFRLTDSQGERRGPFVVTIDGRFAPRKVKADEEGNVWLVFEVDEDAQPAELRYNPSFGFKQSVKFTLE